MIKNNYLAIAMLTFFTFSLASCQVVGDIFKAGMWTGLLIVAVVIVLIIWLITRFNKK